MLFLLAGITALAFARLGLVATGAAVDWRRNPAWLALLLLLLGGDGRRSRSSCRSPPARSS